MLNDWEPNGVADHVTYFATSELFIDSCPPLTLNHPLVLESRDLQGGGPQGSVNKDQIGE